MTRGCRAGVVTKDCLAGRLSNHLGCPVKAGSQPVAHLLGAARFLNLVSDHEYNETVPRTESTIPCYLYTHVKDQTVRDALDTYVVAASQAFTRGTYIANLIAQRVHGSRHPGADAVTVAVWRPRFDASQAGAASADVDRLIHDLVVADPRSSTLKHVFLPERWPSADTALDARVADILRDHGDVLPQAPDWRAVMTPTGWDNAINRMATKYSANIQVHARAELMESFLAYLNVVPLHTDAPRDLLIDSVKRLPRPLIAHVDDLTMVMTVREMLAPSPDSYPLDNPPFTQGLLRLHLFLCRYGVSNRSYLPVAGRGRKYCYLDTKVTTCLLATANKRRGASSASASVKKQASSEETVSVGELLGLDPQSYNATRGKIRAELRRKYRRQAREATGRQSREYMRRKRAQLRKLGRGTMAGNARIDSVETDGVGLRLCVKTPIDMASFIKPWTPYAPKSNKTTAERKAERAQQKKDAEAKRLREAEARMRAPVAEESRAIHVALDLGRAKPFAAAISTHACQRPTTSIFTRRRFYNDMMYWRHQRWEAQRMASKPAVREALDRLSNSGGLKTCDHETWLRRVAAERRDGGMLDDEFVRDKDRALWRMRMFCKKRASLNCAVGRMLRCATEDQPITRPLVMTVGTAGFPCTGKGELPAPTAALSRAIEKGLCKLRRCGRQVTVQQACEFRTTMCCCACGHVTQAARVTRRERRGAAAQTDVPSRRLRSCTQCDPAGKRRDRDVQAARNILWVGIAMYNGFERPSYLTRGGPTAEDVAALCTDVTCYTHS